MPLNAIDAGFTRALALERPELRPLLIDAADDGRPECGKRQRHDTRTY